MTDLNALVYTPLAELRASLEQRLKDATDKFRRALGGRKG